jgi:hypothetical protein
MANVVSFGQPQAFAAKYFYEKVPYTWGPQTINPTVTPISAVSVSKINSKETPSWMAILESYALTQNPNVAIGFKFDRYSNPLTTFMGFTDAMPAGVRRVDSFMPAVNSLSIDLKNSGTSPVSNFQFNYWIGMKKLTVADKLLMGIEQFTKDEQDALAKTNIRDLVREGKRPLSVEEHLHLAYSGRFLARESKLHHVDVGTSDSVFAICRPSDYRPGAVLVLRGIAVEGAPNIVISVDRDDDLNYVGLNGSAFVDADDRYWDMWVPALDHFSFHAQAPSSISAVPIRIDVSCFVLSDLIKVQFGMVHRGEVDDDLYLKAIAGVI